MEAFILILLAVLILPHFWRILTVASYGVMIAALIGVVL